MKRSLGNFTRGSQLLGHFGFMFAAGFKWPLILSGLGPVLVCWWLVATRMSDHETYLVWMHIYASFYTFMEFDPAKIVMLESANGTSLQIPISQVASYSPVHQAWARLLELAGLAIVLSGVALVPAFVSFYWFAERFGSLSKARRHERGAALVSLPELRRDIAVHCPPSAPMAQI
ncbi:MAG: hypothetical protein H6918_04905 [Sphingomonadaceae bacterium]|nr:hypothetical protein [Sphingomonadaceae bacterium]